jgi:hypothetical protein
VDGGNTYLIGCGLAGIQVDGQQILIRNTNLLVFKPLPNNFKFSKEINIFAVRTIDSLKNLWMQELDLNYYVNNNL